MSTIPRPGRTDYLAEITALLEQLPPRPAPAPVTVLDPEARRYLEQRLHTDLTNVLDLLDILGQAAPPDRRLRGFLGPIAVFAMLLVMVGGLSFGRNLPSSVTTWALIVIIVTVVGGGAAAIIGRRINR